MTAKTAPLAFPLALICALVASDAGAAITRGPFLQNPTTDSIVVAWEHDEAAAPVLRWGATADLGEEVIPAEAAVRHEIRVTGLEAGQTYHYALYGADGEPLTEPSTFAPSVSPGNPFRFLASGDSRSNFDVHTTVATAMEKESDVAFYVNTGDLVASGDEPAQWDEFFAIEQPLMRRIPLFPTIGNHDEEDGDASLYLEAFVLPDGGPAGEHYYSVDYGNVHLTVLDGYVHSEIALWCIAELGQWTDTCWDHDQAAWLDKDLRAAAVDPDIDHIVVVNHVGPYSSKEGRIGSGQMRENLPFFREMGVTFILTGHDHYYERGFSGNGIPYIITGGGGAPLYDIGAPSSAPHDVSYNESASNYLVIDVDGPIMRVAAKTPDGRLLDEMTIDATPECSADADCEPLPPSDECPRPLATCSLGGRCMPGCVDPQPADVVVGEPADQVDAGPAPASDVVDAASSSDEDEVVEGTEEDAGPPPDVAAAPPSVDDGAGSDDESAGSGCATGGSTAAGPALLALLMALLLLARRRSDAVRVRS